MGYVWYIGAFLILALVGCYVYWAKIDMHLQHKRNHMMDEQYESQHE